MNQRVVIGLLAGLLLLVSGALVFFLVIDRDGDRSAAESRLERSDAAAVEQAIPVPAAAPAAAGPAGPAARFTRAAVTDDPNGFSNVRAGPSVEHPVVARVEQGDTFTTYPQEGEWWEVRTADGTVGYMARAYIRPLGANAPAQPPVVMVERPAAPGPGPTQQVAAAPAPARGGGGMIFPDSDRRLLSRGDVSGLSLTQLRLARNEIYARRGRIFSDPNLANYYRQFGWYSPRYSEVGLNRVESANVALLQAVENGR